MRLREIINAGRRGLQDTQRFQEFHTMLSILRSPWDVSGASYAPTSRPQLLASLQVAQSLIYNPNIHKNLNRKLRLGIYSHLGDVWEREGRDARASRAEGRGGAKASPGNEQYF